MLDAAIVDIAVGMVLVFCVMAMVASGAAEALAQLVMLREVRLQAAIRALLGADELVKSFYESPFIKALGREGKSLRTRFGIFAAAAFIISSALLAWGIWVRAESSALPVIVATILLTAAICAYYVHGVYKACPARGEK
jgi:hypothetical protein